MVARALTPARFGMNDLLLAAGVAALALGLVLARKGHLAQHRRPYVDPNGPYLLGAGAVLVGAGLAMSVSAIIVWLV